MKKILSIFGTLVLCGTASTSLVACGEDKTDQKQKTDLSELSDNVNVSGVTESDVNSFINQLVLTFQQQSAAFRTLSTSDINALKFNGQDLVPSDIVNNPSLVIKVNAKSTSTLFKGTKDISVSLTVKIPAVDLNEIITDQNLGTIYIGNINLATEEQIKRAIKTKYSTLQADKINIIDITKKIDTVETTAKVISNDVSVYTGEVIINFVSSNFIAMTGTDKKEIIYNLATDNFGNVFATSGNCKVYKCLKDQMNFEPMTGTEDKFIYSLATDNFGNVYAGCDDKKLYKCLKDQIDFKPITGIQWTAGIIYSLVIDQDQNMYASNDKGTVFKCLKDQMNFEPMTGTEGKILKLAIDNSGNGYAASDNGIVYKCLKDQMNFEPMTGISGLIHSLATDNSGNVYAGSNNDIVYRCLKDQMNFEPMTGTEETIWSLTTDSFGNIYAGSSNGKVYKCLKDQMNFTEMTGTSDWIRSLATDNSDNIYASNDNGTVYKSKKIF